MLLPGGVLTALTDADTATRANSHGVMFKVVLLALSVLVSQQLLR